MTRKRSFNIERLTTRDDLQKQHPDAYRFMERFAHDSVALCRGRYGWTIILFGVEVDGCSRKRLAQSRVKMWRERVYDVLRTSLEQG